MKILYHHPFDPFSRKIRILIGEKKIEAEFRIEKYWERREGFLALNPAGTIPVLQDSDGAIIVTSQPIAEYLDETVADPTLIAGEAAKRAEIRRLCVWFDNKFNREVTDHLFGEKVLKWLHRTGTPDSEALRAGRANLDTHLRYISYLTERRLWLAGDKLSLADLAAAAQLSCLDFIGDVPWDDYPDAKQWYVKIKSRPSFQPLLQDQFPGLRPSPHYADLDF